MKLGDHQKKQDDRFSDKEDAVKALERMVDKKKEKLKLPNVTLVCVDDLKTERALKMTRDIARLIDFADAKVFSSSKPVISSDFANARDAELGTLHQRPLWDFLVKIPPINKIKDYDEFIFKDLNNFISTDFCMIIQLDGHPIRTDAWRKEFLDYDYIGAPWTWVSSLPNPRESFDHCPTGNCVGNSGFSIRSKKLMEVLAEYEYDFDVNGPEDEYVCRKLGEELKSKGIKFAPVELATMFSVENNMWRGQFGFHGKSTYEMNKTLGIFK